MRRAVIALLTAALGCVIVALVVPGNAGAADAETVEVSIGGAPFSTHPGGVLLDVDGLAPGQHADGTLAVRSGMHAGSRLSLRLVDVHDDGELGSALRFSVAVAGSDRGAFVERWSGPAAELGAGIDAVTVLGVGATKWVRLTASLPAGTGNEVQGDAYRFGVRLVLQDVGPANGIAGTTARNVPGSGTDAASSSRLSLTGVPLALLAAAAALLLVAGGVVLTASRPAR